MEGLPAPHLPPTEGKSQGLATTPLALQKLPWLGAASAELLLGSGFPTALGSRQQKEGSLYKSSSGLQAAQKVGLP